MSQHIRRYIDQCIGRNNPDKYFRTRTRTLNIRSDTRTRSQSIHPDTQIHIRSIR